MEDDNKVAAKIAELQKQTGHKWVQATGFYAITGFEFEKPNQSPNFNPAHGVPVKIFIDTVTGEIRTFAASIFRRDANA